MSVNILEGFKPKDTPMLLLPYQQNWLADTSGIKTYTKSRRIGISWAEAADDALHASRERGSDVIYMGFEKDMTRGFIEDCGNWAKFYNLAASSIEEDVEIFRDGDENKSIFIFRIYFNSGFKIEAVSAQPRNLRSKQARVVYDEAAFMDEFNRAFEAGLALRIWGSDIRVITTYNGIDNEYYEFERDILEGKKFYARHFTTFRMAVAEGLYRRICLVKGTTWTRDAEDEWVAQTYSEFGDKADQELDCIPKNSSGAYLSRIAIEQCMVEVPLLRWKCNDEFVLLSEHERDRLCQEWINQYLLPEIDRLNPDWKSYFGEDFGRSGNMTIILPLQEDEYLRRRCPFAIELFNVPYEQQKQVLFWLVDRLPRFLSGALDARGNGNYLSEVAMQCYGTRIHRIQATQPWYNENFPKYKAGLQDRQMELPKHGDWLDDHRQVVSIKGNIGISEKNTKGEDGVKRHGDGAIAGLMAWFASLNAVAPLDFQFGGETYDSDDLGGFDL